MVAIYIRILKNVVILRLTLRDGKQVQPLQQVVSWGPRHIVPRESSDRRAKAHGGTPQKPTETAAVIPPT